MSYSRWIDSRWYIFWQSHGPSGRTCDTRWDQHLAVWCCLGGETPTYDYAQVRDIVDNLVYDRIPGYTECDGEQKAVCRQCLTQWVKDVEDEMLGHGEWITLSGDPVLPGDGVPCWGTYEVVKGESRFPRRVVLACRCTTYYRGEGREERAWVVVDDTALVKFDEQTQVQLIAGKPVAWTYVESVPKPCEGF